jgi:predicted dehydrogenase
MKPVGVIGCGGIARDLLAALKGAPRSMGSVNIVGALARSGRGEAARTALPGIAVVETLDGLLARRPDLIPNSAKRCCAAESTFW